MITKKVNIRRSAEPREVLYQVLAPYDPLVYPQTAAGKAAFELAVAAGSLNLTTLSGYSIPAGTRPPLTPPVSGTTVNWLSAWSTYAPGVKYMVAASASEPLEFKFERVDGVAVTSTNPDNIVVHSGLWYGSGELSGEGSYTQKWELGATAIVAGVAYRLSWRKKNTPGETFSYTYTPATGTRVQLFTASSTNPTNPGTPISYSRGLFVGNSITLTRFNNGNSFNGMAASAPEKDYMHLVAAKMRTLNPNFQYKNFNDFPELVRGAGTGPYFEATYWKLDQDDLTTGGFEQYNPVAAYKPDIIFMRIAENIDNDQVFNHNLELYYKQFMTKLASQNPTAQFVLTTSSWNQTNTDAVITKIATDLGLPLANLEGIPSARAGEAGHPDDTAHQVIADRIWDKVPKVTNAPTGTGYTSEQLNAMGLDGNYVAAADQGWDIVNVREKYIESSKLKIGFLRGGGGVSFSARKDLGSGDRNLTNSHLVDYNRNPSDFRFGRGKTDDLGRQEQSALYIEPRGFDNGGLGLRTVDGHTTSQVGLNTGNNPVQCGNSEPYTDMSPITASATYTHPTRGSEFYVETRAQIWGLENTLGDIVIQQWASFATPTTKRTHQRITVEPHNTSKFLDSRKGYSINQEFPCMWLVRDLDEKLINIPGEPNKNINPGGNEYSQKFITTDCRIGAYGSNTGVTYYSPYNSIVGAANNTPEGWSSGETLWSANNTAYIVGAPQMNLNSPGIYEMTWYTIYGPKSDADFAMGSLPGPDQSFDFDFSKENMLWYNGDSRLLRENGLWTWYMDPHVDGGQTSFNGRFTAPCRAWQASGIKNVTFEFEVFGATSLKLFWQKPGQLDTGPQFTKSFDVQNNKRQTITVSTADPNFNGIISTIGLQMGNIITNDAKVMVHKIYKS